MMRRAYLLEPMYASIGYSIPDGGRSGGSTSVYERHGYAPKRADRMRSACVAIDTTAWRPRLPASAATWTVTRPTRADSTRNGPTATVRSRTALARKWPGPALSPVARTRRPTGARTRRSKSAVGVAAVSAYSRDAGSVSQP